MKFGNFNLGLHTNYKPAQDLFQILLKAMLFFFLLYNFFPLRLNSNSQFWGNIEALIFSGWAVIILLGLSTYTILKSRIIKIGVIDLVVVGYTLFSLLHFYFIKAARLDSFFIIENSVCILTYLIVRFAKAGKTILFIIVVSAFCQIIYGINKQTMNFAPGRGLSDIHGSFFYQSGFAGFLACPLIIACSYLLRTNKNFRGKKITLRLTRFSLLLTIGLFTTILIYTFSRAAWFGAITGITFLIIGLPASKRIFKKHIKNPWQLTSFITVLIIAIILLSVKTYSIKKDSADGRLLIWNVTINMIFLQPYTGFGLNQFRSNYMHFQAEYLKNNPDDTNKYLADNTQYAYNELLKVSVEQGIGGLAFFILLVISIVMHKPTHGNREMSNLIKACIFSLLVFGCFSFPSDIYLLKLLFAILLALLANNAIPNFILEIGKFNYSMTVGNKSLKFLIFLVPMIILSLASTKLYQLTMATLNWHQAQMEIKNKQFDRFNRLCLKAYPHLQNNADFLYMWGKGMMRNSQYENATNVLDQAVNILPSTDVYIDIGKCQKELGNYLEAEKTWQYAEEMVPAKFYPGYLTAMMYQQLGNTDKAVAISQRLLNKKVKTYSIPVHNMLSELKKMANDHKNTPN